METRDALRTSQLRDECQIAPEMFEQGIPRLYSVRQPFGNTCHGQAADLHATTAVCGLLADVERQNIASIAARFGHARLPWHACIGWEAWDDAPLRQALLGHVTTHVGQADGVLVCDPAGFPTSGRESVGVAKPWCGRLGKVDTCQVALSVG